MMLHHKNSKNTRKDSIKSSLRVSLCAIAFIVDFATPGSVNNLLSSAMKQLYHNHNQRNYQ